MPKKNRFSFYWASIILNAVFILGTVAVSHQIDPKNLGFLNFHPHPFWGLIFWSSLRYGFWEAVVAALMSGVVYCGIVIWGSEGTYYFSTLTLFSDFRDPFLFLIMALILGDVTQRHQDFISRFKIKLKKNIRHALQLKQKLKSAHKNMQVLTNRISGQLTDAMTVFDALADVKSLNLEAMPNALLSLLVQEFQVSACAYYEFSGGKLKPLQTKLAKEFHAEKIKNPQDDPIIQEVLHTKAVAHIADHLEESKLERYQGGALIAGPVLDANGRIVAVVAIFRLPFLYYHLGSVKLFRALLKWWGHLIREKEYLLSLNQNQVYNQDQKLYQYTYFLRRLKRECLRIDAYNIPVSVGLIRVKQFAATIPEKRGKFLNSISDLCAQSISELDMVASYEKAGHWVLLFSGLKAKEAKKKLQTLVTMIHNFGFRPYLDPGKALILEAISMEITNSDQELRPFLENLELQFSEANNKPVLSIEKIQTKVMVPRKSKV